MTVLDIDFNDVQEPTVVEADEEVELRILACEKKINKSGDPYIMPQFEVIGEDFAKDFGKYMALPSEDMDKKKLNRTKWALKLFLECFSVDPNSQVDPEDDLPGQRGYAILGVKNDDEFGEQNFVKKFVTPK